MVGIFGTAWAIMQFLFSPAMGSLSDRFGRRPIVLLSNLGLGLDYHFRWRWRRLSHGSSSGRIISGITAASVATAGAYIADVSEPEKRAKNFGMLGVAFGIGFILGPAVGGILGSYQCALSLLGRGSHEPAQFRLRVFCLAGIPQAGKPQPLFAGPRPIPWAR